MRYVSLLFIVFLMWWSWSVAKAPSIIPEATHIGVQDDLRRVISDYITENIPGAKDLKFDKFWTESLKEDKIKATFSYSFDEGNENGSQIGVEGYAILNRSKEENSEYDVWTLDELNVLNNRVIFKDGITVRNGASSSSSEP